MNKSFSPFADDASSPLAMAMLCTVLRTRGLLDEAFALGVAAVEAAPHDMEVRDIVATTLSSGVAKWHRPMLHDHARNEAYARGISSIVKPGMTVLEIGSGAGLLSLLAARCGARVFTCEANPIVAAAARAIVAKNGYSDRITVIQKLSNQLELGSDLPCRADLLMSELFDDTLFGDGIVEYIADARERLLVPDAEVLPRKAELRLSLVGGSFPAKHRPLAEVQGFDLSSFNVLAPRSSTYLRVAKLGGVARSQPASALLKDFQEAAPFGPDICRVSLQATGEAVMGVAQWLRFEFTDDIAFENDPFQSRASHWGSPVIAFPDTLVCAAGEEVALTVRRIDRGIFLKHDPAG